MYYKENKSMYSFR